MTTSLQVAICGQSIAWAAVESVLSKSPYISIIRITEPGQWANLATLGVDIVLFDESKSSLWIERLKRHLPDGVSLLGINFDNSRLVLHLSHLDRLPAIKLLMRTVQREGDSPTDPSPV
ncbi:MAG: hypothetical protein Kow0031_18350 [Anaerolineae bacterium]